MWKITARIGEALQTGPEFKDLWVEGEVGDAHTNPTGDSYFVLKDSTAELRCVLFGAKAVSVPMTPRTGAHVIAHGSIQVYIRRGFYQLVCDDLRPAGIGDAYLRLEALKKRLTAEGLFARERKRPLPTAPRRVGVVTSPSGAAWRDIQSVVARRDPRVEIVFAPAQVQGAAAVESLVGALDGLRQLADLDVVIIARGGGAGEDLSPFNDEALVRAIARFPIPVCSGVGHETDVSLVDAAADVRAPTPSVAAELVVPDATVRQRAAERSLRRIETAMRGSLRGGRERALRARRTLDRRAPAARVAALRQRLDEAWRGLDRATKRAVPQRRQRAVAAKRRLDDLSPLRVVARGYAIVEGVDGRVRTEAASLRPGEGARVRMRDGRLGVTVNEVTHG